jgi:hypothetical protein
LNWNNRIERSLSHVNNYWDQGLISSAQFADEYWAERLSEIKDGLSASDDDQAKSEPEVTPERTNDFEFVQTGASHALRADKEYRSQYQRLRSFYNNLALCTNQKNCDRFTACQYFFGPVSNFRQAHLESWHDSFANLFNADGDGIQIETFLDKTCVPFLLGIDDYTLSKRFIYGFINY